MPSGASTPSGPSITASVEAMAGGLAGRGRHRAHTTERGEAGLRLYRRFESRRVVPAGSFAHRLSCSAAILAAVRQKRHLSNPFKNPEPALFTSSDYERGHDKVAAKFSCAPYSGIDAPSHFHWIEMNLPVPAISSRSSIALKETRKAQPDLPSHIFLKKLVTSA
jgi:hypothetical protein